MLDAVFTQDIYVTIDQDSELKPNKVIKGTAESPDGQEFPWERHGLVTRSCGQSYKSWSTYL